MRVISALQGYGVLPKYSLKIIFNTLQAFFYAYKYMTTDSGITNREVSYTGYNIQSFPNCSDQLLQKY